jgi:hypothetical protein
MNWYSLSLKQGGDGLIEDAWKLAWEVARSANALDYSNAIFQKAGPGKAEVTLYFTPSAGVLAASFGAKRCDKPLVQGMSLVAGDDRAWQIHFGGKPGRPPVIERLFRTSRPAFLEPAEPPLHFEPTHPSGTFEPTHPAPLR